MSHGFDDREKGLESRWAHDEDLRFRAIARRNRLLAEWAAEAIGLREAEVKGYVAAILEMELRGAHDDDLVRKVREDFAQHSVAHSEHTIRRKMEDLAVEATDQIMSETKA